MLLVVGDLSYADNPTVTGSVPGTCTVVAGTYQTRWDTFQRLFQPLLSTIPSMFLPGNHEIEWLPGNSYFNNYTSLDTAFNARFPSPQRGPLLQPLTRPISGRSSGYANGYWAAKVQGVATFITLTSYSPNDVNFSASNMNGFSASSEQYVWLEQQLKVWAGTTRSCKSIPAYLLTLQHQFHMCRWLHTPLYGSHHCNAGRGSHRDSLVDRGIPRAHVSRGLRIGLEPTADCMRVHALNSQSPLL